MRGFPFRDTPTSIPEKVASLGFNNRWVRVDTAVLGDTSPILLVDAREFQAGDGVPSHRLLTFDGHTYGHHSYDPTTQRHVYVQVKVPADVHEGREAIEKTADNWPIGGDTPQVTETPGVEVHSYVNFATGNGLSD